MNKSPDAFRTISEVAEVLEIPAHVLRFWESRFPQVRPVKRAGGRRYYRPADVALLVGIKRLLHHEGMTIRGVQKILREQGVRVVSGVPDMAVEHDADLIEDGAFDAVLADGDAFADGLDGEAVRMPAKIVLRQGALDGPIPGHLAAELHALEPDDAQLWDRDALVPAQLRDGHDADLLENWDEPWESDLPADEDVAFDDVARSAEAMPIPPAIPSSTAAEAFSEDPSGDVPLEATTPAARLRALHAAALPLPRAPLEALATRLSSLRGRMSAAARPHRR